MTKLSNTVKTVFGAVALMSAASVNAATVNVGGIEWDTFPSGGNQSYSVNVDFQQWFTAGDYTNDQIDLDSVVAAAPTPGMNLTGVGVVTSFSIGRTDDEFCAVEPCELTFSFGGLELQADGSFDTSSSWLNLYYDNSPDFDFDSSAGTNMYTDFADAQDGDLWLSLVFDSFTVTQLGNIGFGFGGLSVVGGIQEVVDFVDHQVGLSDVQLNSSAFGGSNCYSNSANGQIQPVSAPSTLAFFGLTLVGLSLVARRKAK